MSGKRAKKTSGAAVAPALDYIAEPLRWLAVDVATLEHDPRNARKHSDENVEAVRRSLARFGQRTPLVVQRPNIVRKGNATLVAARALGWTHVAAVFVEETNLDAQAYAIADNRTAELATWDDAMLEELLRELRDEDFEDLGVTGFDQDWLTAREPKEVEDPGPQEPPAEPTTKTGDLWILGDHRLLCGDSTKPDDVARLMGDERAGLFATDPPYGVDYSAVKDGFPRTGFATMSEDWGDMVGDEASGEKLQPFLESVFRSAVAHALAPNAAWYIWHAHLTQAFFAAAAAANLVLHRQIIWKKPHLVLTRSGMYHWQHEPCFYGWVKGFPPEWLGERNQTSVWEVDHDDRERCHPTQKPLELFSIPMRNHLATGAVCYEAFSGSGSQIIAAEKLGRRCFAMEIAPRYVDAVVARWEAATGKKAKLEGAGKRRRK